MTNTRNKRIPIEISTLGHRDFSTRRYIAHYPSECRNATDRTAYELAIEFDNTICVGFTIARPWRTV